MNDKMNDEKMNEMGALSLEGLEIEDLKISEFLTNAIEENSDNIAKVMAASCTTCECCCSC